MGVLEQRRSFTTGVANNAGVSAGALFDPEGVTVNAGGNVYVADYGNSRILEYRQPYPISARIELAQGWNLVSLPSQSSLPYAASLVLSQVNQEGGDATVVAIYQNGA
jgi:DNA-binding beta-propeller fold protein YncE